MKCKCKTNNKQNQILPNIISFSIISVIYLVISIFTVGCENYNLEKMADERADFMYYGESEKVDSIIQLEAQAEGWEYYIQDTEHSLIKTGNPNVPFLTTVIITFRNPEDKNIFRSVRHTYIFDIQIGLGEWVLLTQSVWEYNIKTRDIKPLSSFRLWQGDY